VRRLEIPLAAMIGKTFRFTHALRGTVVLGNGNLTAADMLNFHLREAATRVLP